MDIENKIKQFLNIKRKLKPQIDLKSTVLLIIDMQEYQVRNNSTVVQFFEKFSPGMLTYFTEQVEKRVIPNIQKIVKFFRQNRMPIYYTKFASRREDGEDLPKTLQTFNELSVKMISQPLFPSLSDPTSKIISELKPGTKDIVLLKTTSGTFMSTDLERSLKNADIDTIVLVGVVTNFCVENTAREAADLGFDVILIEDACAAWSPRLHEGAIQNIELRIGHTLSLMSFLNFLT